MDKIARAREIRRAAMINAEAYTDAQAATVKTLYPEWIAGEAVVTDDPENGIVATKRYRPETDLLYKCRQSHTTQKGWEPELTPALWVVVEVEHTGTIDDPITAASGMEYVYGKYYFDPTDEKLYLCSRTGEAEGGTIVLNYLPHELVGQYFTLVDTE